MDLLLPQRCVIMKLLFNMYDADDADDEEDEEDGEAGELQCVSDDSALLKLMGLSVI